MKVLFINAFQNSQKRGAETFVSEVSKRLAKKFSVHTIGGKLSPKTRWSFVWRAFIDPNGISILAFTLSVLPRLFREKYDVVIPVNGGWMPAVVRIVTWIYGGKMVVSGQSGIGWDERNNLWCFPDLFVALSQSSLKWARGVNPFVKSVYIPNGVDTRRFSLRGVKLKLPLKRPIILCVAATESDKRIDLTVQAVSGLKTVSLLLVGSVGKDEESIVKFGKKLLRRRFCRASFPLSKMPSVYRSVDAFTLVSKPHYAFEIAIVEAMATGLPVVVGKDPIREGIVGSHGICVDPNNPESYKRALLNALGMGKSKKAAVQAKKFDWDKIAQLYEGEINNLFVK